MASSRTRFSALLLLLCFNLLAMPAFAAVSQLSLADVEALLAKKPQDGNYLLVDSRPDIKFFADHLPWAKSIPWQEMKERLNELPANKGTKLVFYCGGVKCDLSTKAAALAVEQGYTDVAVFAGGMPAWIEAGKSPWVATGYIKMILNDPERIALLVDARPAIKYNEGTLPGALNIPFQEWDKRKGMLPNDKNMQLVFFCGGLKCDLSFKSADKAREMGYTDVRVYAYGWPDWQQNSTRAFAMVNPKEGSQAAAAPEKTVNEGEISKDELLKLMAEKPAGFLLVDVRPADEFAKAHIPGAINILDEQVAKNCEQLKGKTVVFYCNTGSRAAIAYYGAKDAGVQTSRFLNRSVDFAADGTYTIK